MHVELCPDSRLYFECVVVVVAAGADLLDSYVVVDGVDDIVDVLSFVSVPADPECVVAVDSGAAAYLAVDFWPNWRNH